MRLKTALTLILTLLCVFSMGQKKMTVHATAYTPSPKENGNYKTTKTGHKLTSVVGKCVAVDPKFIPLNSKVYVPGVGMCTALDTGGAIKGRRIDVLLPSRTIANRFGRRDLTVTVYPPERNKASPKKKK
jgi:3D (Asp-Asp-Asp) domain-containing protein